MIGLEDVKLMIALLKKINRFYYTRLGSIKKKKERPKLYRLRYTRVEKMNDVASATDGYRLFSPYNYQKVLGV